MAKIKMKMYRTTMRCVVSLLFIWRPGTFRPTVVSCDQSEDEEDGNQTDLYLLDVKNNWEVIDKLWAETMVDTRTKNTQTHARTRLTQTYKQTCQLCMIFDTQM
jgi:hypothetical protein